MNSRNLPAEPPIPSHERSLRQILEDYWRRTAAADAQMVADAERYWDDNPNCSDDTPAEETD